MLKKKKISKRRRGVNIKLILSLVIVLALVSYLIISSMVKECGLSNDCFKNAAKSCAKAKFTLNQKGDVSLFEIMGKDGNACNVKVTLINSERMPNLTGKGVTCVIPKESLIEKGYIAVSPLSNECTGPIKEELINKLKK